MTESTGETLEPSGFFVLRTPALPFSELSEWASGLSAQHSEADLNLLRQRLREKVQRPHVRDALFVSSQSLDNGVSEWMNSPGSKKSDKVERALVRYLSRMAGRSTPFGLFSGITIGRVGDRTDLRLQSHLQYRRLTRIDADYLFTLCHRLGTDRQIRESLIYRPNETLVWRQNTLRYVEASIKGATTTHRLVSVTASPHISSALILAADGATLPNLAAAVARRHADEELSNEEVNAFLHELIDAQLLVSDLYPLVTGGAATEEIAQQLERIPSATSVAVTLRKIDSLFASIDAGGLGASPAQYRAVELAFGELPVDSQSDRRFQVDMVKPAVTATLGPEVIELFAQGIRIVHQMTAPRKLPGIQEFCTAFNDRYGEQELPLLEVLDEEDGIGFHDSGPSRAPEPLLAGLVFPPSAESSKAGRPWSHREAFLLGRLEALMREGGTELSLNDSDLNQLRTATPTPLPDAFYTSGVLVGPAHEGGADRLLFKGATGPCGTRLFGRFCYADEELHEAVVAHQQAEAARLPDAIFAEIVHQPSVVRLGNVVSRPVLREFEIPYWGRSGAPRDRQIPVDDLLVSVRNGEIQLRSRRLGRRVVPRMTNAHNHSLNSPGIYRFLCSLVNQGVPLAIGWQWGALDSCRFLPRVVVGNVILSRAAWLLTRDDLRELPINGDRSLMRHWREQRGLPRFVELLEGDNELPIDLDNPLCAAAFSGALKQRASARLTELLPPSADRCVTGPEGVFANEVQIPFVTKRATQLNAPASTLRPAGRRSFAPGSEWLYVKLYSGPGMADGLLSEVVAPIVTEATARGEIDSWFFIRYSDPESHLRLRLHGDPRSLTGELLPRLHASINDQIEARSVWKMQLDTYEREVERYGGDDGILCAEQFFFHDSQAILECILAEQQSEAPRARWQVAALGIDWLLDDMGFDDDGKLRLTGHCRESYSKEFGVRGGFRHALSAKYRSARGDLQQILGLRTAQPDDPVVSAFRRRSEALQLVVAALRRSGSDDRLSRSLPDIAMAYIHMHVNRLLPSSARAQEFVLYEFLERHYESKRARAVRASTRTQ